MTARQQQYVDYLRQYGETDQAELMRVFGVSQRACSNVLNRLLEAGAVSYRSGDWLDRNARYESPADWLWRIAGTPTGRRRSRPSYRLEISC